MEPPVKVTRVNDGLMLLESSLNADGQLHGWQREYDSVDTSMLWKETHFVNGKKDGMCRTYYINHNFKEETHFVNDEMEGPYREYDVDGNLRREVTYVDGMRHGFEREWAANKTLTREWKFENDNPISTHQFDWHDNGNPKRERTAEHECRWDRDGNLVTETKFVDGEEKLVYMLGYYNGKFINIMDKEAYVRT